MWRMVNSTLWALTAAMAVACILSLLHLMSIVFGGFLAVLAAGWHESTFEKRDIARYKKMENAPSEAQIQYDKDVAWEADVTRTLTSPIGKLVAIAISFSLFIIAAVFGI